MAENTLPSSKLKTPKRIQAHRHANWEPIFCANCGADGGYVPAGTQIHAFWLCDDCYKTHGIVAGTMAVPDEVFWKRVAEDTQDPKNIKEL